MIVISALFMEQRQEKILSLEKKVYSPESSADPIHSRCDKLWGAIKSWRMDGETDN